MTSDGTIIALLLFFACWGSFLNVLGYRLIRSESIIFPRSHCPHCLHLIYWYDNIPVFSWFFLKARCRHCNNHISALYPFIELLTIFLGLALFFLVPFIFFIPYFIFFSALITIIRSDLESLLISQFTTIFLVPVGFLASGFGYLPITFQESLFGAFVGYLFLYTVAFIFYKITKKQGMGEGDMELMALIGSFTGIIGCWASLLIASITGSILGLCYTVIYKPKESIRIPFGPFLALGAIVYVLFQQTIFIFLLV